jgi:A/G-specific adenine glycosylase
MWPELIQWYNKHKRDLPWRDTRNPYFIWLSEVILQQTRVDQGLPYYQRYIHTYPTVFDLANAPADDVMKLWQGLGYYSRAINMHHTAQIVVNDYAGKFPNNYDGLIKLKGIGPYTAAAIASFAFDEPKAVVDGNVFRVLARVFAEKTPINATNGKKLFSTLAQDVLAQDQPATHNQAMMELGATVCKPTNPLCPDCPLQSRCLAFAQQMQSEFPVKLPKNKPTTQHHHYLFIVEDEYTYIVKRDKSSIWKNLHEPPVFETADEVAALAHFENYLPANSKLNKAFETKHQLTHRTIYATFWTANIAKPKQIEQTWEKVHFDALKKLAVHRLFDKFLNNYNLRQS